MRPLVGSYIFASSFTSVDLPAPFSPTIATTVPAGSVRFTSSSTSRLGARIGKRHVLEADALGACQPRRHGLIDRGRRARRRSPPATPAAGPRPSRCRAGTRSRRRSPPRSPTGARPPPAPAARRRPAPAAPTTTKTIAPTYPAPNTDHASVCHAGRAPSRRGDRPVARVPRRAPLAHQPLADAGDAHLLAGRRRGGDVEDVPRQACRLGAPLVGRALDGRPPRRGGHGGQRQHRQQRQRGMDRHQEDDRHAEPQNPSRMS